MGKWQALMGEESPGKFYARMTMELRENGTVAWVNVMPDVSKPGQKVENRAEGRWEAAADGVIVHLEKSRDGRPIPEDETKVSLTWKNDAGVEWLIDAQGAMFKRAE